MTQNRVPRVFTVAPGDPWTINGKATHAQNPQDALGEIFDVAEHFPVRVRIRTATSTFALDMDEQGRTTPVEERERATTAAAVGATVAASSTVGPTAAPDTASAATLAGTDTTPPAVDPLADSAAPAATKTPRTARFRTIPLWKVAVPALLLPLVGIGVAMALSGAGEEPAASAPGAPPATETTAEWKIPGLQQPVTVLGDHVVTLEGNTLRVLDAATGSQVGTDYRVADPARIRYMEGDTSSAVDTGADQVLTLAGSNPQLVPGALNARGTEPVIVDGRSYTAADGSTHSLDRDRGVLAGTTKEVVLAGSPNKVFTGKTSAELKAPEAGARISQWVGATSDRAVVVWSRGADQWLTTHDMTTGAPKLHQEIGGSTVSVRSGVIWVGQDRYLRGDQIKKMCAGGKQINHSIVCPGPDGWTSPDHEQTFPEAPDAASRTYAVIDGTVTPLRTEQ